ncbi:MAG TPA: hypothetical protein VF559_09460 [Caulobacteraceae bacterium]|jgi:hypothetical protein
MREAKVTVGGAVGHALSLFAAHWRALWGVLALNALAATVTAAGRLTLNPLLLGVGVVMTGLFGLMLYGALYRLAFADRHGEDPEFRPAQLGVQWRRTEWRLLLALLLQGVALGFIALLLLLAAAAVLFGLFTAQGIDPAATFKAPIDPSKLDPRALLPLALAQLAVLAPLVYVGLRLSLVMPATADRKAVQVFRTWKWTRGQVLRILMAEMLMVLPFLLLNSLAGRTLAEAAGLSAGEAMATAVALGIPSGAVLAPLSAGLAAYFYRNLAPPPERSPS